MSDHNPTAAAPAADPQSRAVHQPDPLWPTIGHWGMDLGHLLYTHNPFYVISAWLVFSGLRASFPARSGSIDVWALSLCLMGYTVLLGVTAILVVRWGQVWDDARSLLLLIVLMLLGTSITFDRILADTPQVALPYYLLGWMFAAAISELLLRALRLRMGLLLRVPYHLLLALLFLYPLLPAARVGQPHDPVLAWQLFGFSSLAAVTLLCLIPAVRRGEEYVADNGSPWRWPWFPWTLFGMLGLCAAFRAYSLCVSLHFVGAGSIFAPYFLVPLVLAGNLLLLEAGIVAGSQRVIRCALGLPLSLVWLAAMGNGPGPVSQWFSMLFAQQFGAAPLVVTLWIVVAFYLLAAVRGVALAGYPLVATLALISLGPGRSFLTQVDAWPLVAAGAWQVATGWRRNRSGDVVAGWCLWWAAAVARGHGTWFGLPGPILSIHVLLGILLVAGYWYRDRAGRYVRRAGVALAVLLAAVAAASDAAWLRQWPLAARMLYPLGIAALLVGYSRVTRDAWSYAGATVAVAVGCLGYSVRLYVYLGQRVIGLNQLAFGGLFFLLAALISLIKAGLGPTALRRRWRG